MGVESEKSDATWGWTLISIPRTSQRLDKFYEGEVSNDIKLAVWKIYPKCCVEWGTEEARSGCGPIVHAEALWLSRWMLRVVWTEMLLICSQYFQRIHSQSHTERLKMKFWLHFVELGIHRNGGPPFQHLAKGPLQVFSFLGRARTTIYLPLGLTLEASMLCLATNCWGDTLFQSILWHSSSIIPKPFWRSIAPNPHALSSFRKS